MTSRHRPWWVGLIEAIGILVSYGAYEWVRSKLGEEGPAYRHATQVINLEKRLHLGFERSVQQFFSHHKTSVQFLNIYYGTIHFVVPLAVLYLLWKRLPAQYGLWRNRVVCATLLALIGFWLWPLMPPRLMPAHFGFIDTDARYGGLGVLNQGNFKDTNLYAAMPSLHVGWAVWCAAAAMPALRHRWARRAVWLYPAFTFATVTATGNHYWLDGVAGVVTDIAGYYLGGWVTTATSRSSVRAKAMTPAVIASAETTATVTAPKPP